MAWWDSGLTNVFDAAQRPAEVREVIDAINTYIGASAVSWPSPFTSTVTPPQFAAANIDVEALGIFYIAAQGAIRDIINNYDFVNGSEADYTVITLCQAAFSLNDFTTPTTSNVADDKKFWDQLHRALNLMTRMRFAIGSGTGVNGARHGEDAIESSSADIYADEFITNPTYLTTGAGVYAYKWTLADTTYYHIGNLIRTWDFSAEDYKDDIYKIGLLLEGSEGELGGDWDPPGNFDINLYRASSVEADAQDRYEQTGTLLWSGNKGDLDITIQASATVDVNDEIIIVLKLEEAEIFGHTFDFVPSAGELHNYFVAMSSTYIYVTHDFVADL